MRIFRPRYRRGVRHAARIAREEAACRQRSSPSRGRNTLVATIPSDEDPEMKGCRADPQSRAADCDALVVIRHTSRRVPSSLRRGIAANTANCAAFDADPEPYRTGAKTFDIKKGIYARRRQAAAEKRPARQMRFLRSNLRRERRGDVEHYRPKTAITITRGGSIGYYWRGYIWENLSYACPDCNGYRKRDLFPLVLEAARALDHHDDIDYEERCYSIPMARVIPVTHPLPSEADQRHARGNTTIKILALDRQPRARSLHHLRQLTRCGERRAARARYARGSDCVRR